MPFSNFTLNSNTFASRGEGEYHNDNTTFSSPDDYIVFRKPTNVASKSKNGPKAIRTAVSRIYEKDVTIGDLNTRHGSAVTLSIVTTEAFSPAELAARVQELATACTEEVISRNLQGET